MSFKSKVISIAAATFFALSIGTGAMAEEAPQVTQEITGGDLTYSLTNLEMEDIAFDYEREADVLSEGQLTLTVDDKRGTRQGWTIKISSTDFIYDGDAPGNHNILKSNFSITPQQPTKLAGEEPNTNGLTHYGGQVSLQEVRTVLTAAEGFGSGKYEQSLPAKLTVPVDSPVGTYTATLTVEATAAPQSTHG